MKLEGLIFDKSDIIGEVKKRFGTEQTFTVGKVTLITTNPTQTITFHVSEELWSDGKGGDALLSLVGQRTTFDLEFKQSKYGDTEGRHREITGFHLFKLPSVSPMKS
uniref:RstB n=1 Tax=Vibrio cholerae TaxID=666 RepID=L7SQ24_VIBCL|nr:RstB [Vibrio cholerae]AKX33660.1 RstB [Vibrio cholerae]ALA63894.1 RstB [Vibrio cholerae]